MLTPTNSGDTKIKNRLNLSTARSSVLTQDSDT